MTLVTLLLPPSELSVNSDGAPTKPLSLEEHSVHSGCEPMFQNQSDHTLRTDRLPFPFEPVGTGYSRYFHGDPFGASDLHTGIR